MCVNRDGLAICPKSIPSSPLTTGIDSSTLCDPKQDKAVGNSGEDEWKVIISVLQRCVWNDLYHSRESKYLRTVFVIIKFYLKRDYAVFHHFILALLDLSYTLTIVYQNCFKGVKQIIFISPLTEDRLQKYLSCAHTPSTKNIHERNIEMNSQQFSPNCTTLHQNMSHILGLFLVFNNSGPALASG